MGERQLAVENVSLQDAVGVSWTGGLYLTVLDLDSVSCTGICGSVISLRQEGWECKPTVLKSRGVQASIMAPPKPPHLFAIVASE